MFSIQEYMDLAEVPENKQTRLAGTYLSGIAKSWYINKYADVTSLPPLADFLANFKKHHTRTNNAVTIIRRIETMKQGHRPAADYGTEFEFESWNSAIQIPTGSTNISSRALMTLLALPSPQHSLVMKILTPLSPELTMFPAP